MPASTITNFSDVFLGSEQSKYAGVALFITILIICISILITSSKIAIEQRILFVLFILIISIPSILMTLFELTCIVTGGNYNTRWWCWLLAWVLSIIIIFYCIMIIISLFISMTSYDMANERISNDMINNKIDTTSDNVNANNYAKNIMTTYEEDTKTSKQMPRQQPQYQQQQYQEPQYQEPQYKEPQYKEPQYQEPPPPRRESSPSQQQYQPPMPPREQQPFPQQSQHMKSNELPSAQSNDANYSGFDMSDNLSSLDSAFSSMKVQTRPPVNVNSTPPSNEIIEAFYPSNIAKFGLF
jgi:hypothetical protein